MDTPALATTAELLDTDARVRVLIDGEDYFGALRQAAGQARRTLHIAGWAIDPQASLGEHEGQPVHLLPFLLGLLARRPRLIVRILVWDFAALMAWSRHSYPLFGSAWPRHRRLRLVWDDQYPFGGCHHQKFVVVDEAQAFAGGIDLSVGRLDSPAHWPVDPRRTDSYGVDHPPIHDAMLMVEGPAAAALGRVFRERWARATGRGLPVPPTEPLPWPGQGPHSFPGVRLSMARTDPLASPPLRQVEAELLRTFAAARACIYLEQQYLSSTRLGEALAARLREPGGPELIVITPLEPAGWLEEVTVGLLRWRVVERLRAADRERRLRICVPMASVAAGIATYVHAKVCIVDDVEVRVGSANFSARSLGLDSELDLGFFVQDEAGRARVRALRAALLAEHLGQPPALVEREIAARGSVRAALDALRGGDHTLQPLGAAPPETEAAEDIDVLVDPDEPVNLASLTLAAVGPQARERLLRHLPRGFLSVLLLCGAFAVWSVGGLDLDHEAGLIRRWVLANTEAPAPALTLVGLGGLLVSLGLPLAWVVVGAVALLGILKGVALALGAAGLAVALTWGMGALLGRGGVRWLLGPLVNEVSAMMLRRGVISFFVLRVAPIAPFPVAGLVAGACRYRFDHYALGSMLGSLPYVLVFWVLGAALRHFGFEPQLDSLLVVLLALIGIRALERGFSRALERRAHRAGTTPPSSG